MIELITGESDKTTKIGTRMSEKLGTMMIEFLRDNVDMFEWSSSNFKGINPKVIIHMLNVDPMVRPVQ